MLTISIKVIRLDVEELDMLRFERVTVAQLDVDVIQRGFMRSRQSLWNL